MTDVLFLAVLQSLADGDGDTARSIADLADDPEAVAELLSDGEIHSEADRSGLILAQVGTHHRTGKPIMRWVRPVASRGGSVKPDAKGTATRLVRDGVKTAADAKLLADSLKQMTTADIDGLKREFQARTGGRLKQEKVDRLVAYARGRGSVQQQTPTPTPATPPTPTPTAAGIEAAVMGEVGKGLSGRHAALRMVPIHEVRAELKRAMPGMTDDQFDEVLLDMRRNKKVRLVSIDDRSRATPDQLRDSVYAVGETFFYIERV